MDRAQILNNTTPYFPLHQTLHLIQHAVRQVLFSWQTRLLHWIARRRSIQSYLSLWEPVSTHQVQWEHTFRHCICCFALYSVMHPLSPCTAFTWLLLLLFLVTLLTVVCGIFGRDEISGLDLVQEFMVLEFIELLRATSSFMNVKRSSLYATVIYMCT